MSGVIMEDGQQWEHCNICYGWVKIQNLGYELPSAEFKHGRDVCMKCVNDMITAGTYNEDNYEVPASWCAQREEA